MSEQDQALQKVKDQAPAKVSNKPGFHNQAAIKARGRAQMLEALTGNKGGKLGKSGLIYKILASLDRDLDSPDPEIYQPARAEALKMAIGMTKDDKADQSLTDMLKAGNVQINFNSYFEAREPIRQDLPGQPLNGQALTIGFTPPPGPGAGLASPEAGAG